METKIENQTQPEVTETAQTFTDGPKIPRAAARLEVPGYPYPLILEVQLVPELALVLDQEINPDKRNMMAGNIVFNMLQDAMSHAMEGVKEKSPIIMP